MGSSRRPRGHKAWHERAEKRFEIDPASKDQVCPQTILQMGIPEAQSRETPDQGHPELRAEARARVFSTEVDVQVHALEWQFLPPKD